MKENLSMPKMPKRVSIEKADNGYVVSCYKEDGEYTKVAKDVSEAIQAATDMMEDKKKSTYRKTSDGMMKMK